MKISRHRRPQCAERDVLPRPSQSRTRTCWSCDSQLWLPVNHLHRSETATRCGCYCFAYIQSKPYQGQKVDLPGYTSSEYDECRLRRIASRTRVCTSRGQIRPKVPDLGSGQGRSNTSPNTKMPDSVHRVDHPQPWCPLSHQQRWQSSSKSHSEEYHG